MLFGFKHSGLKATYLKSGIFKKKIPNTNYEEMHYSQAPVICYV